MKKIEIEAVNTTKKHFAFDKSFQEKIIQAMIYDRNWACQFSEVLNIEFFEYNYLKLIADKYVSYHKKYKEFPSTELLTGILVQDLGNSKDAGLKQQVKLFLEKIIKNENAGDLAYVKERSLEFCKKQSLQNALESCVELIVTENYDKVTNVIKDALVAGSTITPGLTIGDEEDIEARYSTTYRKTIATGIPELDKRDVLNGGLGAGEIGVVVAPTGCHAKGTKILMFNGALKNVEDIEVGAKIMGPDSRPRNVLNLVRGNEKMYKVKTRWGYEQVYNENHTLALTSSVTKKHVEITIKDYLKSSKWFKHTHFWYQPVNGIEFKEKFYKELLIEPYVLGLLLGDGSIKENRIELTTTDSEIKQTYEYYLNSIGMNYSYHYKKDNKAIGIYGTTNYKDNNVLRNSLRSLKLINKLSGDKFIPHEYKISSKDNRLKLLAGLIDTDGSLNKDRNSIEYCTKSIQLAKDIAFLSRSLGFAVTERKKFDKKYNTTYNRLFITGDLHLIPTKLERKQAAINTTSNTRHNVCKFSIEELENDNFYGFTVDSDNLYLTQNMDVNRNCGKSHVLVHLAAQGLKQGKNVIFYTFELNERALGVRIDSHLVDISSTYCFENKEEIKEHYKQNKENYGKLFVKYYPTGTCTVQMLRNHIERLSNTGFKPDMIVIDYAGIMRSSEKYDAPRFELKKIFEELRGFAGEADIPVWTATQSNREGASSELIDTTNMAESYGQAHICDFILGLSRKQTEKSTGFATLYIAKNRAGIDGIVLKAHLDTSKSKLRVLSEEEMRGVDNSDADEKEKQKTLLRQTYLRVQKNKEESNGLTLKKIV